MDLFLQIQIKKEMEIMDQTYILYNPKAGNGACKEAAELLGVRYNSAVYCDMTKIGSFAAFFQGLDGSDAVILCGGDGTLHRFANDTRDLAISNPIYYLASGNRNDFRRDLEIPEDAAPSFRINDYLRGLPSVFIHGQKHLFLNSVGFGMDETRGGIKGLPFSFRPGNAIITVDGDCHPFKKVWLAAAMHGRYCGGGMMAAPEQDRVGADKTLSVTVMHGAGPLKILLMLPSMFKGKHIRYKKHVTVLTGHEITVEFDRPTPLQMDGERIAGVRAYQAKSAMRTLVAKNAVNGGKRAKDR